MKPTQLPKSTQILVVKPDELSHNVNTHLCHQHPLPKAPTPFPGTTSPPWHPQPGCYHHRLVPPGSAPRNVRPAVLPRQQRTASRPASHVNGALISEPRPGHLGAGLRGQGCRTAGASGRAGPGRRRWCLTAQAPPASPHGRHRSRAALPGAPAGWDSGFSAARSGRAESPGDPAFLYPAGVPRAPSTWLALSRPSPREAGLFAVTDHTNAAPASPPSAVRKGKKQPRCFLPSPSWPPGTALPFTSSALSTCRTHVLPRPHSHRSLKCYQNCPSVKTAPARLHSGVPSPGRRAGPRTEPGAVTSAVPVTASGRQYLLLWTQVRSLPVCVPPVRKDSEENPARPLREPTSQEMLKRG